MSGLFLDTRAGRLALYLNGDLQFDRDDEELYHQPLALVPLALVSRRAAGRKLRVLVLGGGDGLALREILKCPGVDEAHLVDHDATVLDLARSRLADLNRGALSDARVRVHVADARDFLSGARGFDAIVCDLTFPRDLAGAAVFTVDFFRSVRRALTPRGVIAVNAVSPELTPEAFGCIAVTLATAGLASVPYAFVLPSFVTEGYGRWGFLFASPEPITDQELDEIQFPAAARVTSADLRAGLELPHSALDRMKLSPNVRDELLYYVANGTPIAWTEPFQRHRFAATNERRESSDLIGSPGPRLTAAQAFAAWLREPAGRRSLAELLACLPLARRGQTRELVLEWSTNADSLLRGVDLRLFVDRLLERAGSLPAAWRRELSELAARVKSGIPSMRELLEGAWRVFAVFLLVLLVANLTFPDNAYAKHTGSSGSGPQLAFSDPAPSSAPFRYHVGGGPRFGYYVYDSGGREYRAQPFMFADPARGPRPLISLLALSPDLRLLETGMVSYAVPIPAYEFVVQPDRLGVLNLAGREVLALHPGPSLPGQTTQLLATQAPLLDRALADHQRWLDWTRWARGFGPGQEASSELTQLERIRAALGSARTTWMSAPAAPRLGEDRQRSMIFPGVVFDQSRQELVVIHADGTERAHSLTPPAMLTEEDRFLFWVLYYRVTSLRDARFRTVVDRWRDAYGAHLAGSG